MNSERAEAFGQVWPGKGWERFAAKSERKLKRRRWKSLRKGPEQAFVEAGSVAVALPASFDPDLLKTGPWAAPLAV